MSFPEALQTGRLSLRLFEERDLDALTRICSDPETMKYIGGSPLSRDETWRAIAVMRGHWALRGYGFLAVEEKSSGQLIGRAGPWRPEGWPGLEVGWMIDRARWGEGFATEAARACLATMWRVFDVPEVISVIHPDNARSIRVAHKLGERLAREGQVRLGSATVAVSIYAVPRPQAV